jgi:alpha-glucosidase (family GH31 glycosyl hydrolase)
VLDILLVAAIATSTMGASAIPAATQDVVVATEGLAVRVVTEPFRLTVTDEVGEVLLDTGSPVASLTARAPRTLGFATAVPVEQHQLGYSVTERVDVAWANAVAARDVQADADSVSAVLATDDPLGRTLDLTITAVGGIVTIGAVPTAPTGVTAMGAGFLTDADQQFLGFGERSDAAVQTGRRVVTWNEEGPFSAGDAAPVVDPVFGDRWQGPLFFPGTNFAMPWFLSSRGYGLLLDSDWLNGFDLGASDPDRWTVVTREPALRLRVYAGPRPADALERFTADTGRQPEPAEWFFGPWVQPGPGPEVFREQDVPVTVAQTYTHYLPCAAQSGRRDGQAANVERWQSWGYRITTYVNSFVCSGHPDGAFEEGDANGYFLRHPVTGRTYPASYVAYVKEDGPYHGIVDFTNPAATAYWQRLIDEALVDGYDGWMEDFGEYVPVDAVTSDGRTGLTYHNRYCTDYHRASHELTWPRRGRDFAQFVRCGYTGTAPYARIVWGADPSEDFSKADGLAAAVSQGLSMGASGIGYWGSDIGGFHALVHLQRTDVELQTRWVQFGAFSGIMRTQKTGYPRPNPDPNLPDTYLNERAEVYNPEMLDVFRRYAKLRTQLFPETWQAAETYQRTGLPIMRHLGLEHADDPEVWSPDAEFQFLFGDDLLVAPVVTDGARERTVYLPEGAWLPFWDLVDYDPATGAFDRNAVAPEPVPGRQYVTVAAPLHQIPLFVRAGACLTLLPAEVDTLADIGLDADGVIGLPEVRSQDLRHLSFDDRPCAGHERVRLGR